MKWDFDAESFSEQAIRNALRYVGCVVIRNVLDTGEVTEIRSELKRAFSSAQLKDLPTLISTEVLKREPIWRTLFKDRIVSSLRAALGPELYYQHDMDVQRNSYGTIGWKRHTGWHMDAGSESGNRYLRAPDYRFVKCAIFLQEFDNGWGGGIRIKPKSHRGLSETDRLKQGLFASRRALNRVALMLRLDLDSIEVPTRAGDFCFFDSRLLHSSLPPRWENIQRIGYDRTPEIRVFWQDIPPDSTKYVIYWDACNAAMVDDFLRNTIKRAASEPDGMSEQRFRPATMTRILSLSYPDDFPADFVAAARSCGIGVASLGKDEAVCYKRKLKTMQLLYP
jgi:ectoine hydroxylase-related dioxygenase (phytanoyl-CoA dioxygenase family)